MNNKFLKFLQLGNTSISNLILYNYAKTGMSATEFVLFLQMEEEINHGQTMPNVALIASRMNISQTEVYNLLHSLFKKKLLTINSKENNAGQKEDSYSFDLFYERLSAILEQESQEAKSTQSTKKRTELFNKIEEEFQRPLTSMEMQTISGWLTDDKFPIEVVQLALREAVLNQAFSLRYMDRILLSWNRQGLTTEGKIKEYLNKRRNQYLDKNSSYKSSKDNPHYKINKQLPPIPLDNWLQANEKRDKNA